MKVLTLREENEKDMFHPNYMLSSAIVPLCGKGPLLNDLQIHDKEDFYKVIGESFNKYSYGSSSPTQGTAAF